MDKGLELVALGPMVEPCADTTLASGDEAVDR